MDFNTFLSYIIVFILGYNLGEYIMRFRLRAVLKKIDNIEEKAVAYCDKVKVYFDEIRYHADKLELLVDDELWPLAKFREMLFTK